MRFLEELDSLFQRELSKVITELEAYSNDKVLWETDGEIKNSGGNLALHLVGNINHFIGKLVGNIDFERDRPAEFSSKNVPIDEIISALTDTQSRVSKTLNSINEEDLNREYPIEVIGKVTTSHFLLHLLSHLSWHLGQINYHRRILDRP